MKEKTEKEKLVEKIFNIKIIAIFSIIISGVIVLANFKKAVKELSPEYKIEYCEKEEQEYSKITNEIFLTLKSKELDYGGILGLKNDIKRLIQFEDTKKDYNCRFYENFRDTHILIKEKLMSKAFSMVEKWEKNEDDDRAKEKVKHICLLLLDFMDKRKTHTKKELDVINSTLEIVSK